MKPPPGVAGNAGAVEPGGCVRFKRFADAAIPANGFNQISIDGSETRISPVLVFLRRSV